MYVCMYVSKKLNNIFFLQVNLTSWYGGEGLRPKSVLFFIYQVRISLVLTILMLDLFLESFVLVLIGSLIMDNEISLTN